MKYDIFQGSVQNIGTFIDGGDSLIADLRGKTFAMTIFKIVYRVRFARSHLVDLMSDISKIKMIQIVIMI